MSIQNTDYEDTISLLNLSFSEIIDEMILFQHTQTSVLRNDNYLIKDKDTQAIFESVLCKFQKKISPNNHQKEYDLKYNNNKISVKSGVVNNDLLKFSYSRTTEHKTLEDKIEYLSKFENLIVGIASEKIKCDNPEVITHVKYYLYYFKAKQIDLKGMQWEENDNVYHGEDKLNNIQVSIVKKMSDQPWIHIPCENIDCKLALSVTVTNRNNRKILTVHRADDDSKNFYDVYENRKKIKSLKGLSPKIAKSTTMVSMG